MNVLHHPEAAPFIEMEIQRLTNRRFARDDLHLQTVTDVEEAQRFFGRERRRIRMLAGAGNEKDNRGDDRKNRATGQPKKPGLEHSLRAIIARGDEHCLNVAQEAPYFIVRAKEQERRLLFLQIEQRPKSKTSPQFPDTIWKLPKSRSTMLARILQDPIEFEQ